MSKSKGRTRFFVIALALAITTAGAFPRIFPYSAVLLVVAYFFAYGRVPSMDRTNVIALALGFWVLLAWATNPEFSTGRVELSRIIPGIVLFIIIRDVLTIDISIKQVLKLVVIASSATAVLALIFGNYRYTSNLELLYLDSIGATQRVSLSWLNINWVGYVLAGGISASLVLYLSRPFSASRGRIYSFTWLLVWIPMPIMLWRSGSRGALLAVIAAVLLSILTPKAPRLFRVLIASSVVVTFTPWISRLIEYVDLSRMTAFFLSGRGIRLEYDPLSGRDELWESALTLINDKPIVGYGAGAYLEVMPTGTAPHNIALSLWLGIGLIGLIGYAAFVLSCVTDGLFNREVGRVAVTSGSVLIGGLLPIWATGSWEWAPFSFVLLAIVSKIYLLKEESAPSKSTLESGNRRHAEPANSEAPNRSSVRAGKSFSQPNRHPLVSNSGRRFPGFAT